jgi:hypothetical protein
MKKLVALALLAGSLSAQADESVDVQTGREQIERIIGNAAIADFCEADNLARLSGVDSETCIQLTPAALESCWEMVSGFVPRLKRPFSEYHSMFDDEYLSVLKELITACVQGDLQSQALERRIESDREELLSQEPQILDKWSDVVARIQAQHIQNEEDIATVLSEFAQSEYAAVYSVLDDEVIVVTSNGDTVEQKILKDPPAWALELDRLGIYAVDRFVSSTRAYGGSRFETERHEFSFFAFTEANRDNPECHESFDSLDCGGCAASGTNELALLVVWNSKALVESLSDEESVKAGQEIDLCVREGIERARSMLKESGSK